MVGADIYTDGSVNNNIILNNNQIELSPNPAAPGDRVKVTDEPFGKKISLFDFQGNIIASYKNIGEFLLPDFIASGVYFVALKQNNGTEIYFSSIDVPSCIQDTNATFVIDLN